MHNRSDRGRFFDGLACPRSVLAPAARSIVAAIMERHSQVKPDAEFDGFLLATESGSVGMTSFNRLPQVSGKAYKLKCPPILLFRHMLKFRRVTVEAATLGCSKTGEFNAPACAFCPQQFKVRSRS